MYYSSAEAFLCTTLATYVFKVIMYSKYCVHFTDQATNDLRQIRLDDRWAARRFLETLAAIEADPTLMARLDTVQYGHKGWDILGLTEEADKHHRYLWRLKIYNAMRYRMIYGIKRGSLQSASATIVVLGVIERSRAYDGNDTNWQNILEGYDEYCE